LVGLGAVVASLGVGLGVGLGPAWAEGDARFRLERLQVPGRVLGVHAEDLTGDKRRDLVVAFATGRPPSVARRLAVFIDHGSGFGLEPDQVLSVPETATFVDVGELGPGQVGILVGEAHAISAFRPAPEGKGFTPSLAPLVKVTGLLAQPEPRELPFFDLLRDWDGDGKPELLVPLPEGVAVFTRSDAGWARAGTLHLEPQADYTVRAQAYEPRLRSFAVRAIFSVPDLVTGDYDGDGHLDLFAVSDDVVSIHRGGPFPTVFSPQSVARHALGARSGGDLSTGPHVHTTVRDLDGDGVADLVVNKVAGGLGQMRAQTVFFYGRKGGGYDPPAQILSREGYAGALAFADLDGDRKPELVMPHVDVGLAEMARVVLSKKMAVGWEVRKNLGHRQFSTSPEAVKDIDFPVDYSQLADIDGPYPSVEGDFNGDGRFDFVAGHGPDAYAIWLGGGKTLLEESPRAIVHVPSSRHYFATDLDGDKRADLVVFYPGRPAGVVHVLRNTGQGW
jgi:hypothetical protein